MKFEPAKSGGIEASAKRRLADALDANEEPTRALRSRRRSYPAVRRYVPVPDGPARWNVRPVVRRAFPCDGELP
jgi:hypothetical protein